MHDESVSILKCVWKVDRVTKSIQDATTTNERNKNIATSKAFEYEGKKLFRAQLELWKDTKNPYKATRDRLFTIKFLSYDHQTISCSTEEVTCSLGQEQIRMEAKHTLDSNKLQVFKIPPSCFSVNFLPDPAPSPFIITFIVKLRSIIPNFLNKIIDSTWSEQLWAAAVNRKMTDVEFLLGDEAFGAHRSILSARSPVFAAMFASGMKEAETGQVRIEDVDHETFLKFLKFLYTGTLETSSMSRELFTLSDRYRVETLMELCRPTTETADIGNIIETFLSC